MKATAPVSPLSTTAPDAGRAFGGAVGAFHGYGEDGPALMAALANELDLGELLVPGRTVNDLFIELVMQLGMFGMTTERIAREAYVLMTEEIGELSERLEVGVVGSSTMPHKVNPKHVVRLQAECARLRAQTAPALEAGLPSHEGDADQHEGLDSGHLQSTFEQNKNVAL